MRTYRRRVVTFVLACFVVVGPVWAQSDTTPPALVGFDFNPKTADVTTGPTHVTCAMSLTDSPSGTQFAICRFRSPDAGQFVSCGSVSPASGTIFDGTWTCDVAIPQFSDAGTWRLFDVTVSDNAANQRNYSTTDVQQLGFPTSLTVVSQEDITPPALTGFTLSPSSVDVGFGPATSICSMSASDSPAGTSEALCRFRSPSGAQFVACNTVTLASGDAHNGTWACTLTFPQFAESGSWQVFDVDLVDLAANTHHYQAADIQQLGFPSAISVASNPDTTPPSLTGFDFQPRSVDSSYATASVSCSMTTTDALSGVSGAFCRFRSPLAGQFAACSTFTFSQGNVHSGVWSCSVSIPQGAETGTWKVFDVDLQDAAGNTRHFATSDLTQGGFPVDLEVNTFDGVPIAELTQPSDGAMLNGNAVTVKAILTAGTPADLSPIQGVRFEYRVLPDGPFELMAVRNNPHPNPDMTPPLMIQWDLSGLAPGPYEIRAVAHDHDGTPDPNAKRVRVTLTHP